MEGVLREFLIKTEKPYQRESRIADNEAEDVPYFFARKRESFLNYDFFKRQAIIIIEVTKGGDEGE